MLSKIKKIRLSTYDKKWSKIARELTPYCWFCKKTENLAAHHFIRRAIKATRLDVTNAVVLCPAHHVFSHTFSAHKTPEKFERWYRTTFPGHYKHNKKQAQKHMTERDAIKEFKELYE